MSLNIPGLGQTGSALAQLGLAGAAGALGGGPSKSTTLQTSTPQIPANVQPLQTGILNAALGGLNAGTNLSGYTSGGLQNINSATNQQQNLLKNTLAARGLTYSSPLATAEQTNISQAGAGQQSQFLNTIPLLRQQLLQQQLSGAVNAFRAQPYGQQIAGTGSITQPGGVLGGLLSGLASGLNLYGSNIGGGGGGGNQTQSPTNVNLGTNDPAISFPFPFPPGATGGLPGVSGDPGLDFPQTQLPPSDPYAPNLGGLLSQYYSGIGYTNQ